MASLAAILLAGLAVAALVTLCWALGLGRKPQLAGKDEAIAMGQSIPGGFAARMVLLAEDGRHALLADGTGKLALVVPHGAHFVALPYLGTVRAGPDPGNWSLKQGHALFASVSARTGWLGWRSLKGLSRTRDLS